jgi:cell division septum initiation protein DivIVA
MAISFSRPDPSSPASVAAANFTVGRRGFEPDEVHEFLRMVAAELARLQEREKFLERELRTAQRQGPSAAVALDEDVVTRLLGEEAARILTTSREAAAQIKARAEEGASRLLREATDEAQRVREEAELEAARRRQDTASDAEAELQMAKQQGREMVNEARAYRERVLGELARRRELARQQIESLVHGRDRLLQAFERARIAAVDVMAELTPLNEPQEFVNLAPTTGPVPLIVPASELPPVGSPAAPAEPAAAEEPAVEAATVEASTVEASTVEEIAVEEIAVEEVAPEAAPVVEVEPAAEATEPDPPADTVLVVAPERAPTRARREKVVAMPEPSTSDDGGGEPADTGRIAPVVSLFAGEVAIPTRPVPSAPPSAPARADADEPEPAARPDTRASVDDLFAKLRAARAGDVAERARAEHPTAGDLAEPTAEPAPVDAATTADLDVADDTPFARRDAELTPLIVTAARKLKRVLADEQNDVLHALRGKERVTDVAAVLPSSVDHAARYGTAVRDELVHAALAGAASLDDGAAIDHQRAIDAADALRPALELMAATLVAPLRERLARAVAVAGDNAELAAAARGVYREWKTQRIDEHLDDVFRTAFGRGAFVVLAPGARICWTVDPDGPPCSDAEDNTLGGVVRAGDPFPTEHVCAPAHEGCRCMLQRAPL